MRSAADAMSLTTADMKPWHLRAKYQQFGPDGAVVREGVFEEWWASREKHKIHFIAPDLDQTYYVYGEKVFFTGQQSWPPTMDALVSELLLHPLPNPMRLDALVLTEQQAMIGATSLQCLPETYKRSELNRPEQLLVYCFSQPAPALRVIRESSGARTTFNALLRIGDHYLARRIQRTTPKGDPELNIEVETIEPNVNIEEAALKPLSNAKPIDMSSSPGTEPKGRSGKEPHAALTVLEQAEVLPTYLAGSNPKYPHTELSTLALGTLVMKCVVTRSGTVADLTVVSGSKLFQPGAMESLKDWQFSPYMLAGEPIDYPINVEVRYLGIGGYSN